MSGNKSSSNFSRFGTCFAKNSQWTIVNQFLISVLKQRTFFNLRTERTRTGGPSIFRFNSTSHIVEQNTDLYRVLESNNQ